MVAARLDTTIAHLSLLVKRPYTSADSFLCAAVSKSMRFNCALRTALILIPAAIDSRNVFSVPASPNRARQHVMLDASIDNGRRKLRSLLKRCQEEFSNQCVSASSRSTLAVASLRLCSDCLMLSQIR